MRTFASLIFGIAIAFGTNGAFAQQDIPYHSCDNVRVFVESLINPALNEEQQELLQDVLRSKGVTAFVMQIKPDDRRSKSVNFNRQIRFKDKGVTSSIRLKFGSTNLSIKDEDTCEAE